MNDEASPSTADWPRPLGAANPDHDPDGDRHGEGVAPDAADAVDEAAVAAEQQRKIRSKRVGYLDDLLRNLDILIYAEISAVYYLDCSFLRFVLRAFVQLIWLTPKPDILPEMPSNRPYIYPICGSNFLCLILHLWFSPPSAGEATRGYLHGGLLIDWIGQQGPTSKFRLFLLDCFILALQLVMLSATLKLQKVKKRKDSRASSEESRESETGEGSVEESGPRQDVDSEERGILRRSSTLSTLEGRPPSERDELLSDGETPESNAQATLDALNSGQALIAELYILDTVREQLDVAFNAANTETAGSTILSSRDRRRQLAAVLARRRLTLATRFGGG